MPTNVKSTSNSPSIEEQFGHAINLKQNAKAIITEEKAMKESRKVASREKQREKRTDSNIEKGYIYATRAGYRDRGQEGKSHRRRVYDYENYEQ